MPSFEPFSVCHACGRTTHRCLECKKVFYPKRSDAKTCSVNCRVQMHRRQKKES